MLCFLCGFVVGSEKLLTKDDTPDPPWPWQKAKMSRHLCHYSNYTVIGTISTRENIAGYPFANMVSYSDGPLGHSTGIPYFYMSDMSMSSLDLLANPDMSIVLSLAQGTYCTESGYDPQDPRCAHVILTGKRIKLEKGSEEEAFAKEAVFSRHPAMEEWPANHGFYFCKLDIASVVLLDFFGGASIVAVEDYFNTSFP